MTVKRRGPDSATIKQYVLMNDFFMNLCLRNPKCVELVLRIILNRKDLHVLEVKTQHVIENLGRSVRLDVFAVDDEGRRYNIEVQRSKEGADVRRSRFNAAMMDCMSLERGEGFDKLCDNYVIFITETDVLKGGLPLYTIDRTIKETGQDFNDGSHIIYVNASYRDLETELGRLMHDFTEPDPDKMYYKELADEARYYKDTEEGVIHVEGDYEDIYGRGREEGLEEGIEQGIEKGLVKRSREVAVNMLRSGRFMLEEIAAYSELALSEVQKIAQSLGTPTA